MPSYACTYTIFVQELKSFLQFNGYLNYKWFRYVWQFFAIPLIYFSISLTLSPIAKCSWRVQRHATKGISFFYFKQFSFMSSGYRYGGELQMECVGTLVKYSDKIQVYKTFVMKK